MWRLMRFRSFLIFAIGGVLNTALSFLVYLGLNVHLGHQLSYFCAFLFGLIFSYFYSCLIVFKRQTGLKSFFSFPIVYAVQYFFGAASLEILVSLLDVSEKVAPLIISFLMLPMSFLLSKFVLGKTAKNVAEKDGANF